MTVKNKPKKNSQFIVEFLKDNPEFFVNNPDLLEELKIPHDTKGSISLVELKLEKQKEKIKFLEKKLEDLSCLANYNEQLFLSLFPLQQKLTKTKNIADANKVLAEWAKKFKLNKAQIYLIKDVCPQNVNIPKNFLLDRNAFEIIRLEKFGLRSFYLGKLTLKEKSLIFSQPDYLIGSVAICLLKMNKKSNYNYDGILVFADHDEDRFHHKQDLSFLKHLAKLYEQQISDWLHVE